MCLLESLSLYDKLDVQVFLQQQQIFWHAFLLNEPSVMNLYSLFDFFKQKSKILNSFSLSFQRDLVYEFD